MKWDTNTNKTTTSEEDQKQQINKVTGIMFTKQRIIKKTPVEHVTDAGH